MGESTSFGGEWIFAFLIIAVLFGGGGFGFGGGNAAMAGLATTSEVQNSINSALASQNAQNILLSSANNNYETAQLISGQNLQMMQQNNTNLLAAINGFNATSQQIATGFSSVNAQIADLGFKMEKCCCDIKTQMLEQRLQDAQIALNNQNTRIVAADQSQYLLSQLGNYVPTAYSSR